MGAAHDKVTVQSPVLPSEGSRTPAAGDGNTEAPGLLGQCNCNFLPGTEEQIVNQPDQAHPLHLTVHLPI